MQLQGTGKIPDELAIGQAPPLDDIAPPAGDTLLVVKDKRNLSVVVAIVMLEGSAIPSLAGDTSDAAIEDAGSDIPGYDLPDAPNKALKQARAVGGGSPIQEKAVYLIPW